MKRSSESGSLHQSLLNETNKRCKLATNDACFPNPSKLGSMQKPTSSKNVDAQRDVSNFKDSIIETYSLSHSSSPLDNISIRSQEDLSQSYKSIEYLLKKPRVKAAGPDTDEENLYFKKDSSSSEDDLIPQKLLSQPSTPCLLSRKPKFSFIKRGFQRRTPCISSARTKKESRKTRTKTKCKLANTVDSLVDYPVSALSQSSSSDGASCEDELNSSRSSSDASPPNQREVVLATSAKKWKVQCLSTSKSTCSSSTPVHSSSANFKMPFLGKIHHNDDVVISPVSAEHSSSYNAAKSSGYRTQTSNSRLNCHSPTEAVSRKVYEIPGYLKSPELCSISPRTNYNFQPYRKFSIPNYDIDEISSDDNLRFIDSHCHLDFLFRKLRFNGTMSKYRLINQDTFPKSYEGCLAVFCDPQTFAKNNSWNYLLEDNDVWGAFGCHPKMANDYNDYTEQHLLAALRAEKVVALGEIGLDYSTHSSDADVQKRVFRKQLKIAVDYQLPLVIHCRDANNDTFQILKEMVPHDHRIHRHCFTGTWKEAVEWLEPFPNLYIGLTPLVTFPSAREVHETARNIPLNRLLLETDAPYFMPKKLQVCGEKHLSHPGMAIHVAAQVAAMQFTSLKDVLLASRENTVKMYGI